MGLLGEVRNLQKMIPFFNGFFKEQYAINVRIAS
jgi:hypothetical protein